VKEIEHVTAFLLGHVRVLGHHEELQHQSFVKDATRWIFKHLPLRKVLQIGGINFHSALYRSVQVLLFEIREASLGRSLV
jgi:hypothetical protein